MDSRKLHKKMAISTLFVISLSLLVLLWAARPAYAEDPPPGSYQETCDSYWVENANLGGWCRNTQNIPVLSYLENYKECSDPPWNDNGILRCHKGELPPPGSYQETCDSYWIENANLGGWCRNTQGIPILSYLENYKECSDPPWNSNGILRCDKGNIPPSGSYRDSCEDIWVEAGNLHAKCKDIQGNNHETVLNDFAQCIDQPWNYDGTLRCNKGDASPQGSYRDSCEDIWVEAGNLHAKCKDIQGNSHETVLNDFVQCSDAPWNFDGNLRCNKGDVPPLGPYHNHCDDIWVESGDLHARCGSYNKSYLVLKNYYYCITEPDYDHNTLFCNKGDHLPPPGSYQKSCTSYWVEFENLFGICYTSRGSKYWTYLENYRSCTADIANIDGTLRCWDNQSPTITSTPEKTAYVGELYRYQFRATDADGDPLTFSLTEHPTGMAFNPQSGLIEWIPVESQIGKHHVTVKVDDGRFGVSTQSFDIDVTQAPQAMSIVTYEMRSTVRCTANLRFTWRPISVHQNGSGSDVGHSDPETGFSYKEAIPSADNICQFQSQLLTPLRLGRWNISVESPYGTLMQCDVELMNGENRTTFTFDNKCSNITVGGSRGIQNPFGETRP